MAWTVLITAISMDEVGDSAIELLKNAGCDVVFPRHPRPLKDEHLIEELSNVDAVLAGTDAFSDTVLKSKEARSLKIISRWGVGFNEVDLDSAKDAGVVVAYTPGMLNDAVADYAFSLLLCSARGVHEAHQEVINGKWNSIWGNQVSGKTLGIVGCGRIGQAVARRATGFNLRILAFDVAPQQEALELGVEFAPLDQLLEDSDFVSLHVALTPDSAGLIG